LKAAVSVQLKASASGAAGKSKAVKWIAAKRIVNLAIKLNSKIAGYVYGRYCDVLISIRVGWIYIDIPRHIKPPSLDRLTHNRSATAAFAVRRNKGYPQNTALAQECHATLWRDTKHHQSQAIALEYASLPALRC
jgi:hypothetical protein